MRVDLPDPEDLGDLTSHRFFVPGLVWAAVLGFACVMALFEAVVPDHAAQTAPPASSAGQVAKPGA